MSEEDAIQKLKKSIEANAEKIGETFEAGKDKFFELVKSFVAKLDPQKAALYTLLAYLGYENLPFESDVLKIAFPIVGFELATTPSEGGSASLGILGVQVPVNSQVAGLSMLAFVGLNCMPWEELGAKINKQSLEVKKVLDRGNESRRLYSSVMTLEEREKTDRFITAVVAGFQGHTDITVAKTELKQWLDLMEPIWETRTNEPNKGSAR